MKYVLKFFLLALALMHVSCKKTEDLTPDKNIDFIEQMLGNWKATDSFTEADGTKVTQQYSFSIVKDPNHSSRINISRFANLGNALVVADITWNKFQLHPFEIIIQNLSSMGEGAGQLSDEKLSYQYTISAQNFTRVYSGMAVR